MEFTNHVHVPGPPTSDVLDDHALVRKPQPHQALLAASAPVPGQAASWNRAGTSYTLQEAFALHSRPEASRRIYLDFNGHVTRNTEWNEWYWDPITSSGLDWDGNKFQFSTAERENIARVWSIVADDFAPFDVDVTTEEPTDAELARSSDSDTEYGIRVVITPDMFEDAGGIAILDSFGNADLAPVFCFCSDYETTNQALVVSHEVGHALGLLHDGYTDFPYSLGQNGWGPIMGAPYGMPLRQWSKGEYDDADNQEDDLAIIAQTTPLVSDAEPSTRQTAASLHDTSASGMISNAEDQDWFSFSTTGGFSLDVQPSYGAPLDTAVELWHEGSLYSRLTPNTLGVTASLNEAPAGSWAVMIQGSASDLPPSDGYSTYGSIGTYTLELSGSVSIAARHNLTVTASASAAAPGATVSFSATSTSDPTLSNAALSWKLSNGSTGSDTSISTTLGRTSLTAVLTATFSDGTISSAPVSIRAMRAPTPVISTLSNAAAPNAVVNFTASGTDPNGQPLTYTWTLPDSKPKTGSSVSAKRTTAGQLTVSVTARNTDGLTGSTSYSVTIGNNKAPTLNPTATLSHLAAPSMASYTSNAKDPEGKAVSVLWDFGYDYTSSEAVEQLLYWKPGSYSATIIATDADGFWTKKQVTFKLKTNSPPTIISAPSSIYETAPAALTLSAKATDPDKHSLYYTWVIYGPNESDDVLDLGATISVNLTTPGTYYGFLLVSDSGLAMTAREFSITVYENTAPTVSIKPVTVSSMAAPAQFSLTAEGLDEDFQPLTYNWSFSDGSSATGAKPIKTFTTAGAYTATVTASDPGGLSATASVNLTVTENHAPTVSISYVGALTKVAPAQFALAANGTDIDKQKLTYTWSLPGGQASSLASVKALLSTTGSQTVTVTATDPGGLSASATITLSATENHAPVITSASTSAPTAPSGVARRFQAAASDPDKQALLYKWVFPDGTTSNLATVSKTFRTPGSYSASVTVTDTGGMSATRTVAFTVS